MLGGGAVSPRKIPRENGAHRENWYCAVLQAKLSACAVSPSRLVRVVVGQRQRLAAVTSRQGPSPGCRGMLLLLLQVLVILLGLPTPSSQAHCRLASPDECVGELRTFAQVVGSKSPFHEIHYNAGAIHNHIVYKKKWPKCPSSGTCDNVKWRDLIHSHPLMVELYPKSEAERRSYPFEGKDLLIGTWRNEIFYYRNTGSGGFVAEVGASNPFTHGIDTWQGNKDEETAGGAAPAATDVNGDGLVDIVVGYGGARKGNQDWFVDTPQHTETPRVARIGYYQNIGTVNNKYQFHFYSPTNTSNPFYNISGDRLCSPTFVDLDDDGVTDLVIGTHHGNLRYFRGESRVGISSTHYVEISSDDPDNPLAGIPPRGTKDTHASFVDLDGDGDHDLLVTSNLPTPLYYENTGTNSAPSYTLRNGWNENPFRDTGLAEIYQMRPTLGHPNAFYYGVGERPRPVFVDADGDGDDDMVVGSARLGYYCDNCDHHASVNWPDCCIDAGEEKFPLLWFLENRMMGEKNSSLRSSTPWTHHMVGQASSREHEERRLAHFMPRYRGALPGLEMYMQRSEELPDAHNHVSAVTFGDLDGDGDLDAVVVTDDGKELRLLRNIGTEKSPKFEGGEAEDLSGCGADSSCLGQLPFPEHTLEEIRPSLYDYDDDGDLDLILGCQNSGTAGTPVLEFFENNGGDMGVHPDAGGLNFNHLKDNNNPLKTIIAYTEGLPGEFVSTPTTHDMNGDGKVDIVVGVRHEPYLMFFQQKTDNSNNQIFERLDEVFTRRVEVATDASSHRHWNMPYNGCDGFSPALIDWDSDGDMDVVATCAKTKQLMVLLNTGNTTNPRFAGGCPPGVSSCSALGADESETRYFDLMLGETSDQNQLWSYPSLTGAVLSVADLDGDNDDDIWYASPTSGELKQLERDMCSPSFQCSDRGQCVYNGSQMKSQCMCIEGWHGTSQCSACAKGYVQRPRDPRETLKRAIPISCDSCPHGLYINFTGYPRRVGMSVAESCENCPVGRFQESPGDFQTCKPCPAGFAQSVPGSKFCDICDSGKFQNLTSQSKCSLCAPGRFTNTTGSPTCRLCPAGKSSLEENADLNATAAGKSGCLSCAIGRFQDEPGMARCKRCPPNQGQTSIGQKLCRDCQSGEMGGGICVDCPTGFRGKPGSPGLCMECAAYFYSKPGSTQCTLSKVGDLWLEKSLPLPCPLGKFGKSPGVCEDCPKGYYQDSQGQTTCTACPEDTYSGEMARSKPCFSCGENTTTNDVTNATDRSFCVCKGGTQDQSMDTRVVFNSGFYRKTYNASFKAASDLENCSACPVGADCASAGNQADTLAARSMYWRSDMVDVHFMDCSSAFSYRVSHPTVLDRKNAAERCCAPRGCPSRKLRDLDEQCSLGYKGMMCAECSDGYVRISRSKCIECPKGSSQTAYFISMCIFSSIVFVCALVVMLRGLSKKDEELHIGLEDQVEGSKKALERQASAFRNTFFSRFIGLLLIIMSWLQVLSALTATYPISWPEAFSAYAVTVGRPANFDIAGAFSGIFCELKVPILDEYMVQIITPIVSSFMVCFAWFIARALRGGFSLEARERSKFEKKNNIYNVGKKKNEDDRKLEIEEKRHTEIRGIRASFINNTMKRFLAMILQMLYPKLATMTFLVFRCREIEDTNLAGDTVLVLDEDFSVFCNEGQHTLMVLLGVAAAALYLVGIPTFLFMVLYLKRKNLYEDPNVYTSYGDLFRMYDGSWYYWELLIIVTKGLICGVMAVVSPGTPVQLLIGTLLACFYTLMVLKAAPYKGIYEDWLGFITSIVITMTLLFGFALSTDYSSVPIFDPSAVGATLIILNLLPVICLVIAIYSLKKHGANHGTEMHHAVERAIQSGAMVEQDSDSLSKSKNRRLKRRNSSSRNISIPAVGIRSNRLRLTNSLVEDAVHSHVSRTTQEEYEKFRRQAIERILARRVEAKSRIKQRLEERRLGLNTHTRRVVIIRGDGKKEDENVKSWKIVPTIDILSPDELEVDRVRRVSSQSHCFFCLFGCRFRSNYFIQGYRSY